MDLTVPRGLFSPTAVRRRAIRRFVYTTAMESAPTPSPANVTQLLRRISDGDRSAEAELMAFIYEPLKKLAGFYLSGERPGHSLQATELIHEVYLKFAGKSESNWRNRAHFAAGLRL